MRKLSALILVVLIGFGGLKFYVYQKVKKDLDASIEQFSAFANIEYGGISTNLLKNQIEVKDIAVHPLGSPQAITIGNVALAGVDFFSEKYYDIRHIDFANQNPMSFEVKQFKVDLDNPIFQHNRRMAYQMLQA